MFFYLSLPHFFFFLIKNPIEILIILIKFPSSPHKKQDQQRKPQPDESQFEAQRLKWQKELDDLRFEVRDRQERIETLSASLEHERAERSSV